MFNDAIRVTFDTKVGEVMLRDVMFISKMDIEMYRIPMDETELLERYQGFKQRMREEADV
jgi:hypothetical protein